MEDSPLKPCSVMESFYLVIFKWNLLVVRHPNYHAENRNIGVLEEKIIGYRRGDTAVALLDV
jgi:hypothetical protein